MVDHSTQSQRQLIRLRERVATIDGWSLLFGIGVLLVAGSLLTMSARQNGLGANGLLHLTAILFGIALVSISFWCRNRSSTRSLRSNRKTDLDTLSAKVALLAGSQEASVTVLGPGGDVLVGGHAFGLLARAVDDGPGSHAPIADRFAHVHPADRESLYAWLAGLQSKENSREEHTYRVRGDAGSWTELLVTGVNLCADPTVGGIVLISRTFSDVVGGGDGVVPHHTLAQDVLTGLPNRRWLLAELEQCVPQAAKAGKTTGVLFLDLDRFKVVNDSLGSEYGDALLTVVARQIAQAVRPKDIVARVGADEFVVLCRDLDMPDEAEGLGHRLLRVLAEPIPVLDRPITTSVSIGLAFAGDTAASETVLRDADIAMVRAKEAGGGRIEVFDDVLRQRVTKRLNTEQELRRALRNNELRLLYQPIVSLSEGMVAAEALVRWHHPTRGVLGPGEFIDVADETGLILGLGDWVLAEGCRTLRSWRDALGDAAPNLTVNLSMRQIIEPSFVSRVRLHLVESGIDPSNLIMEITEDSLVNELDRCVPVLSELAALGLGIAIDDFGTGLSSLSYVKRLPMARTLKIDRSFVTDIHEYRTDHAIVQAVLVMAERLGIRVVAEGVETQDQLSALVELGCKYLQGYFFSPPLESAAILEFDPETVRVHGVALGVIPG